MSSLRARLFLAPWWVQALVTGTIFGAYMGVFAVVANDQGVPSGIVSGIIGSVVFGLGTGWFANRERNQWRAAVGRDLSEAELRRVHRAAVKGPVPDDPRLRLAAIRSARRALSQQYDRRLEAAAVLTILPLLVIGLSVFDSPWWLVAMPPWLYGGYLTWAAPRKLRARINALSYQSDYSLQSE